MPDFPWLRRHPIAGALIAAGFVAIEVVGMVWGLFSDQPLIPTVVAWAGGADMNIAWLVPWLSSVVAVLGLCLLLLIVYQTNNSNPVQRRKNWNSQKLTLVSGQKFQNEKVLLDGRKYEGCEFRNITFVLKGGPFGFNNNDIFGNRFIELDKDIDPGTELLVELMAELKIPANKPLIKNGGN